MFVDLRGYGRSIKLTGAFTIEEIAGDCFALVDQLGWERFDHQRTFGFEPKLSAPGRVPTAAVRQ